MQKIMYLVILITCSQVQATLGDAVDLISNVASEYHKQKPEQLPTKAAVKQESTHTAPALACEFGKGILMSMAPQALYLAYRVVKKCNNPSKILRMNECVTLTSMSSCAVFGLFVMICSTTLDHLLRGTACFTGFAAGAGLLYKLTCHYRN